MRPRCRKKGKTGTGVLLAVLSIFVIAACSEGLSPEEKALRLAKSSHALGEGMTVEERIQDWLKQNSDEVVPLGWQVEKDGEGLYLVNYRYEIHSFDKGVGTGAYVFEVGVDPPAVENVTDRFKQKIDAFRPPFKDEDQAREGVVEQLMREEALLSGKQRAGVTE